MLNFLKNLFRKPLKELVPEPEPVPQYTLVEEEVEFDELESTFWLKLIDGTEVTFKQLGSIYPSTRTKSLLDGYEHDLYNRYAPPLDPKFVVRTIYNYYNSATFDGTYKNENGIVINVNIQHIMLSSVDSKPTGNKVKAINKVLKKIDVQKIE